ASSSSAFSTTALKILASEILYAPTANWFSLATLSISDIVINIIDYSFSIYPSILNCDKSNSSSSTTATLSYSSAVIFFLIKTRIIPVTADPTSKAVTATNGLVIAGITKTPPDGTGDPFWK